MLAELAAEHGEVLETFAQASDALGYDLWKVCQEGPDTQLNSTECTQPAMLTAGMAVWRVWLAREGRKPDLLAGHSLGEYTALVCADALSFSDAVALVADRGRYMQDAVAHGVGAVAAILGLDDDPVIAACLRAEEGEVVRAVNFNAPGQVVIAGHTDAVDRAIALAQEAGAKKAVKLPLSVPVHSPLMTPAAERFAGRLSEVTFSSPTIPVLNNVDVTVHTQPERIRDLLSQQLHSPVRWADTIHAFDAAGVEMVIESGPGKVLAGLNRRVVRSMGIAAMVDVASIDKALAQCSE
jgi:[acyl-carrier-protein] S-malonyltransferase